LFIDNVELFLEQDISSVVQSYDILLMLLHINNDVIILRICLCFQFQSFDIHCNCIIVWGPFCLKFVRVKLYSYACTVLTWVQVLVTRTPEHARLLLGSYLMWFTYCGIGIATEMLVHWLLVSGVSYCDNRERVFMFDYDTTEKDQNTLQSDYYSGATPPRTNRIASCFDALSITRSLELNIDRTNVVAFCKRVGLLLNEDLCMM
jgi:hypothetical protein